METEDQSKPARGLLFALGTIGLLLGVLLAAELAVPLQPALGGGGGPPPTGSTVIMPSGVGTNLLLNFEPPVITVFLGVNNTVTFQNEDSVKHTVTSTTSAFDSGDILPNGKWPYNFTTPGNFSYYCIYHATWMKGKVVVKGTSSGIAVVKIPSGTGANTNLNYSPSALNLVVGVNNTVVFVNEDITKHTVTATDGSFDSGDIQPGLTWSHTFSVGTFSFHCTYHSYMSGSIRVRTP